MLEMLLGLLLQLLVLGLIFGLLWGLCGMLPEPFRKVCTAILLVAAILVLITILVGFLPGWHALVLPPYRR